MLWYPDDTAFLSVTLPIRLQIQTFEPEFRCGFCIVSIFKVAIILKKEEVYLIWNADNNLLVYTVS
jgi:hypothetical protein